MGFILAMLAGVAACGTSGASDRVPVRVGGRTISASTLAHWVSVLAGGRAPAVHTSGYTTLRLGAAELLISAAWSRGEAARHGLRMSPRVLRTAVASKQRSEFPGGETEAKAYMQATGENLADIQLEVEAQWAVSQLRDLAVSEAAPASAADVAAYYKAHRHSYFVAERREVVQTESKTLTEAMHAKRRMTADKNLLTSAEAETLTITPGVASEARTKPAESAIATARLHKLEGPVKQRVDYYVFVVKRIYPAFERPLGQVRSAIASQIESKRRRRALAAFESAWITRWSTRTDCAPGYVVAPCRQHRGPRKLALGFGLP